MKQAFQDVDQLIAAKNYEKLEKDFSTCEKFSSPKDPFMFTENLSDSFKQTVQYNEELKGMTIATICSNMSSNNQTAYENLQRINKVSCTQEIFLPINQVLVSTETLMLYFIQNKQFSAST